MIITEKIDGENVHIHISDDGEIFAASRTQWIEPGTGPKGFAAWVYDHKEELLTLGPGDSSGEWWGSGIKRGYGLQKGEKRFSLFNVHRWKDGGVDQRPACCGVVPILYTGPFDTAKVDEILAELAIHGSYASPGFMNPEGVVVFHTAGSYLFKKTIKNDEKPKSLAEPV
jgi:hypothetical protein